jgi:hypothetical protein
LRIRCSSKREGRHRERKREGRDETRRIDGDQIEWQRLLPRHLGLAKGRGKEKEEVREEREFFEVKSRASAQSHPYISLI